VLVTALIAWVALLAGLVSLLNGTAEPSVGWLKPSDPAFGTPTNRYGFDPNDRYYYGDGYLYQVDPATMLISQVVSAILR